MIPKDRSFCKIMLRVPTWDIGIPLLSAFSPHDYFDDRVRPPLPTFLLPAGWKCLVTVSMESWVQPRRMGGGGEGRQGLVSVRSGRARGKMMGLQ